MSDTDVMALARKALDGDAAALVRCIGEVARSSGSGGGGRTVVVPAPRAKPRPRFGVPGEPGRLAVVDERPLHDRVWVTPGVHQFRFGSTPMGSSDPNAPISFAKTRADTSYYVSARLPEPESFEITGLTLLPEGGHGRDVDPAFERWLRQEAWLTVSIGAVYVLHELPAVLVLQARRATPVPLDSADEDPTFGTPVLSLAAPIFIPTNWNHYFELSAARAWDGVPHRLRVVADGWHYLVEVLDPGTGRSLTRGR